MTIKIDLEYDFLTKVAADVVRRYINSMVNKLLTLKHVEVHETEEGFETSKFNSDTYFRELFYEAVEEEIRKAFYKV